MNNTFYHQLKADIYQFVLFLDPSGHLKKTWCYVATKSLVLNLYRYQTEIPARKILR